MFSQKFNLKLLVNLPVNEGFSFDELITETRRVFEEEGMGGFVGVLVQLLDLMLIPSLLGKWQSKDRCCKDSYMVVHSKESKCVRTTVGQVPIQWTRLKCKCCGKSIVPLRSYLGLESFQRKTGELEKVATELVSEQSFRRSRDHLKSVGSIEVPHTTLHRWFSSTDAAEIPLNKRCKTLVADGTGFKQKTSGDTSSNRGEVKVVIGISKEHRVIPYGAWTEESWGKISNQIRQANKSHPKVKFNPVADLLVSDGEPGLIKAMGRLTKKVQRCIWHVSHDLPALLKYKDKVEPKAAQELTHKLAEAIDIPLPSGDHSEVGVEDRLELEKRVHLAEKAVQEMIDEFKIRGYRTAAKYLINAKDNMFNYVRTWLKTGDIHPRASSMIERLMRELGRRLKRIGHGWSKKNAAKMANILIKRTTTPDEWEKHWREKLKLTGKLKMTFLDCDLV